MKKTWNAAELICLAIRETAAGPIANTTIDGEVWDAENCWWDCTVGEGDEYF